MSETKCPDCGKEMPAYGRMEYDRHMRKWRDIFYCYHEKKWFELSADGKWIRRKDKEI